MRRNDYISIDKFFFFDHLAVGQRDESQAGWVAARLVRMLCRPRSTWIWWGVIVTRKRFHVHGTLSRTILHWLAMKDGAVLLWRPGDQISKKRIRKIFCLIRWSGVFRRFVCTIALRSSWVLQRVATILSWHVWGKTKIRELIMIMAILYWHVWGNKKRNLRISTSLRDYCVTGFSRELRAYDQDHSQTDPKTKTEMCDMMTMPQPT